VARVRATSIQARCPDRSRSYCCLCAVALMVSAGEHRTVVRRCSPIDRAPCPTTVYQTLRRGRIDLVSRSHANAREDGKKATAVGNKAVYSSKIDTEDYVRSSNTKIGDNIVCQDLAGVYIHVVFGQKKKGRRLRTSTCKWARDQASGPYRVGHGIPVTLRDTGAACGRRQHICSVHRAREAHAGLLPCCGSTVEYFLTRSSTTLNSVLNH
jgi:hypothetical protein